MDAVVAAVLAVAYRWISYLDDLTEKRVSDWDHAVTCARCGATLVHVYTVTYADGKVGDVGKECLDVRQRGQAEHAKSKAQAKQANDDYVRAQRTKRVKAIVAYASGAGPRTLSVTGEKYRGPSAADACTIWATVKRVLPRDLHCVKAFTVPGALPGTFYVDFFGSHDSYRDLEAALVAAGCTLAYAAPTGVAA